MNILEEFWYGNIEPAKYDTGEPQNRYPLFGGTASPHLPLYSLYAANNACCFSFSVLQYPWRLSPFVRDCCGDSILTNSIAFF